MNIIMVEAKDTNIEGGNRFVVVDLTGAVLSTRLLTKEEALALIEFLKNEEQYKVYKNLLIIYTQQTDKLKEDLLGNGV